MIYPFLIIIAALFVFIIVLLKNYTASKKLFEKKIDLLESMIYELKFKLKIKNDEVKISEELLQSLNLSNKALSAKIVDMNISVFEDLFQKKNDLT